MDSYAYKFYKNITKSTKSEGTIDILYNEDKEITLLQKDYNRGIAVYTRDLGTESSAEIMMVISPEEMVELIENEYVRRLGLAVIEEDKESDFR